MAGGVLSVVAALVMLGCVAPAPPPPTTTTSTSATGPVTHVTVMSNDSRVALAMFVRCAGPSSYDITIRLLNHSTWPVQVQRVTSFDPYTGVSEGNLPFSFTPQPIPVQEQGEATATVQAWPTFIELAYVAGPVTSGPLGANSSQVDTRPYAVTC